MTDTAFVELLDRLAEAGPTELNQILEQALISRSRQQLLREALAFYGLFEAARIPIDRTRERAAWLRAVRQGQHDASGRSGWLLHRSGDNATKAPDADTGSTHQPRDVASLRRALTNLRELDHEVESIQDFTRRSGVSASELDRYTPIRSGPHEDRVAEPHKHRMRKLAAAGTGTVTLLVAAAIVLTATLSWVPSSPPSPAITWVMGDERMAANYEGPVYRGFTQHAPPETAYAARAAAAEIKTAWTTLRTHRHTFLREQPAFDSRGITVARSLFEHARSYEAAPISILGEAAYGLAVTAWIDGDPHLARQFLADSSIAFSVAVDRGAAMAQALSRALDSNSE